MLFGGLGSALLVCVRGVDGVAEAAAAVGQQRQALRAVQAPSSMASSAGSCLASSGSVHARNMGLAAALLAALLPLPPPQPWEAPAGVLHVLRQLGSVGSVRPSGSEAERSELVPPLTSAWDSSSSEPCGVDKGEGVGMGHCCELSCCGVFSPAHAAGPELIVLCGQKGENFGAILRAGQPWTAARHRPPARANRPTPSASPLLCCPQHSPPAAALPGGT